MQWIILLLTAASLQAQFCPCITNRVVDHACLRCSLEKSWGVKWQPYLDHFMWVDQDYVYRTNTVTTPISDGERWVDCSVYRSEVIRIAQIRVAITNAAKEVYRTNWVEKRVTSWVPDYSYSVLNVNVLYVTNSITNGTYINRVGTGWRHPRTGREIYLDDSYRNCVCGSCGTFNVISMETNGWCMRCGWSFGR